MTIDIGIWAFNFNLHKGWPLVTYGFKHKCGMYIYSPEEWESHTCPYLMKPHKFTPVAQVGQPSLLDYAQYPIYPLRACNKCGLNWFDGNHLGEKLTVPKMDDLLKPARVRHQDKWFYDWSIVKNGNGQIKISLPHGKAAGHMVIFRRVSDARVKWVIDALDCALTELSQKP